MNLNDHFQTIVLGHLSCIQGRLDMIDERLKGILMNQQEMTAELTRIKDQVTKIGAETATLLTRIAELTAIIESGPVSTELQAALDAVKAQVQVVDDLVPDQA